MKQERIDFIHKKISSIMPDAELRTPDGRIVKTTYVCAYDDVNDISVRVSFLDGQTEYHIEYMQNVFIGRHIKEENAESFECFFFVLEELMKSVESIRERCRAFPNYTKTDARTVKINGVLTSETL